MSKKRGLTEDTSFPTKKIVIIGDAGAGKSTFKEILKNINDPTFRFPKKYKSTAKYNLELIDINVNNGKVPLELWDTTGQEDFKNERGAFLRGADGIVIIYDIDNDDSYKNLKIWLELCKTTCPNESVVIFGNKADKYDDIQMARSAHSRDAKLKTMVGHEKLKHFLISMRDDTHLVFNNNYFGKNVEERRGCLVGFSHLLSDIYQTDIEV